MEFFKQDWDDIKYDIYNFYPFKQIRSFYYNVTQGICNIFKWRKIVWNDRDWDSSFVLRAMLFKFENMEKLFNSDHVWSKNAKKDYACPLYDKPL